MIREAEDRADAGDLVIAVAGVGRVFEVKDRRAEELVNHAADEGVHHIAVAPTNFDQALADQAKKGHEAVLSGTFNGVRVAYLPTEQDLGVIVEIFSRDPAPEQKPDAT